MPSFQRRCALQQEQLGCIARAGSDGSLERSKGVEVAVERHRNVPTPLIGFFSQPRGRAEHGECAVRLAMAALQVEALRQRDSRLVLAFSRGERLSRPRLRVFESAGGEIRSSQLEPK